jgi:signal transduction histidine kinase
MNLIMNAVDAMSDVSGRNRILSIKSQPDGPGTVQVIVQDSGNGIKPDEVERIFDAFYTTKSEGMGMGLFICRTIIESHGGRLWAEPCAPHGSAFNVTLPSAKS